MKKIKKIWVTRDGLSENLELFFHKPSLSRNYMGGTDLTWKAHLGKYATWRMRPWLKVRKGGVRCFSIKEVQP